MFTVGGSHARLSCRQGTDLWIDMVCKLVPFIMPWKHGYGSLRSTYERVGMKVFIEELYVCEILSQIYHSIESKKVLCYYYCDGMLGRAYDARRMEEFGMI